MTTWPWVSLYASPVGRATFKQQCEDFVVEEQLLTMPQGHGEHLYVQVEKQATNSAWVAQQLADYVGIAVADVGYAGKKDRQAIARQWFSLYLPCTEPAWAQWPHSEVRILSTQRHDRKLRRGELAANRFQIRLRDWQGERASAEQRLQQLANFGVANYFGPQRFGHNLANLAQAEQLFTADQLSGAQKALLISTGRAYLFNHLVSARIQQGHWQQIWTGDVLKKCADGGDIRVHKVSAAMTRALQDGRVALTASLWGNKGRQNHGQAQDWETQQLLPWSAWQQAIARWQTGFAVRPIAVRPQALSWQWQGDDLSLSLQLPAGSYATSVLLELVPAADLIKTD